MVRIAASKFCKSIDYGQVIMGSNQKKDATLGMPHGTANNRLRKNILFSLLKKYGEDICSRCSEPIEMVEDLSIEHVKPWEGISAELFWDLKNIAFSHLHCNVGARRIPHQKRMPTGDGWCSKCKKFKSREEFYASKSNANGLQFVCKECTSALKSSGAWSNGKAAKSECRSGL